MATSGLQRIAGNIGAITLSNFVSRIFILLLNATIARAFGAEGLGAYASATAIASYFVLGADMGLSPRLVREGAVRPAELGDEYARSLALKVPITLVFLVILAVLYLTLPYTAEVLVLTVLMSLNSLTQSWSYLNHSICRARERLGLEGISHVLHGLFFAGGAALFISQGAPLLVVGILALTSASCQFLWSRRFASRFARLRMGWPPRFATLRDAMPYAAAALGSAVHSHVDILLMSVMLPLAVVGEYAAITRLLRLTGFLSMMAGHAVLPTASRVFSRSREEFGWVAPQALTFSLTAGGAAATGLFALASFLLRWIFGEDFEGLAPLFRAGAIYAWITFGTAALATLLTACGRQAHRARSLMIGSAVRALLVVIAAPAFGVGGALAALLISEGVLLASYLAGLGGLARMGPIFRVLVTTALSFGGAVGAGIAAEVAGWPVLAVLGVPFVVYPVLLTASGETTRVWRFLRSQRRPGVGA